MNPYISEDEIVALMQEIVQLPTINPPANTTECAKFILDRLNENGISAQLKKGKTGIANVLAKLSGQKKGKVLLLNGHIDVVTPGEGWTVDPFGAEVKDGMIYGRGASDMKSGIVSMMAAMIGFRRSGKPFDGEIIFMAVGDEETGSQFGTRYLLENNFGTNANFAIIAEPTNLAVELGNRGLRWLDICITGKACHASRPHLGVNAILYAAKLVEAIESHRFERRDNRFEIPTPSMSVTMIDGGTQVNVIPNRCRLTIDRRMIPGETTETVIAEVQEIIDSILSSQKEAVVEVKMRPTYWDPYLISETEPIVQAIVESINKVIGKDPVMRAKAGCTDGSHIFHIGKIPAVIFGPGIPELAHKVDEYVPIKNVVMATEILMTTFENLLAQ